MKYLLVHWSIHDGENEYDDYALVKTEKKGWDDKRVFKKVLRNNYGEGLEATEKTRGDSFTLPNDYRMVNLEGISEITEEERNALQSTRVVSWETGY